MLIANLLSEQPKRYNNHRSTRNRQGVRMTTIASKDRAQIRVLLVDDEPTQRLVLEQRLKALGVEQIFHANDGGSAMAVCEQQCDRDAGIDLIITDLAMEPIDGLGLIRGLADRNCCVRPALAIASAMDETVERATSSLATALRYPFMGFIVKPIDGESLQAVLNNFEAYLHNRREPDDRERLTAIRFEIDEIEAGLAADQFVPYFQPTIKVSDASLYGVEALARWQHPRYGIIEPDRYVPILEETGKIHYLTDAVARQSIEHLAQFRRCGIHASVSINLSLSQLQHYDIVSRLRQLCRANGVPHHRVMIEVTETAHIRDVASTLETLCRLRLQGFGLSLDDFGTGYSSIQNLDILPINEIKIDKSFVCDIRGNAIHHQLVESVIALGRNLGVQVVAEGVETEEHYQLLVQLGCDVIQGYHVGRPVTAETLIEQYGYDASGHSQTQRARRAALRRVI